MSLTIGELQEALKHALDNGCTEETEVRFMAQPNWPFEYSIRGVVQRSEFVERDYDDADENESTDFNGRDSDGTPHEEAFFLVEGNQKCYGSKEAWDAAYRR
jgi:hypothetical protein